MSNEVATVEENAPAEVLPAQSESAAIFSMIERAAKDPTVDMDKMERLLQMQTDVRKEKARVAFNAAMARAQREIEPVARDRMNDQTRSKYAQYEAISKAIKPIVTKHGFATSFGSAPSPVDNHYRITCEVSHEDGYSKTYEADIPADVAGIKGTVNKTATHAFGSTMSYGRRYLTMLIFDIATEDDDGNAANETREKVSEDQVIKLRDALLAADRDEAKFCKYLGLEKLSDIYADKYQTCINMINKVAAKGAA